MAKETFHRGQILRENGAPAIALLALVLVLGIAAGQLATRETGTFQAPDVNTFIVVSEEDGDGIR